jgi:hypothetical protein
MNGEGFAPSSSMPGWLLYPATLVLLVLFVYALTRTRVTIARFTMFMPWLRYMFSVHHAYTFQPSFIGMSWNALASSGVFLSGVLLVKRRNFGLKLLVPTYLVMAVVVLSGIANHDIGGTIDVVVKFGYLVVVMLCLYEALGTLGEDRMMQLLLWSFAPPILLQVISIAFGISKASEADNSVSFIGGYHHESAFSIVLATCFFVACFASGLKRWLRSAILLGCLVGIIAANYRTTILAIAPLVMVQFNADVVSRFPRSQRVIIGSVILAVSLLGVCAAAWILRDRFADMATVLESPGDLFKPPEYYTIDQRHLLSSRPYIWSGYIYGYLNGGTMNHLLGFGPDSWQGVFDVYAHNTLVSTLYEYGLLGVVAMSGLWATMLFAALRIRHGPKSKLVAAHLSFFLLNMATMPHWMIEGDIFYGLICGYTLHLLVRPAKVTVAAPAPNILISPISARSQI